MLGLGILDLLDVSGRILAGDDASLADHIPDRPTRLLIPRPRVSGFGKSSEKARMPAPGPEADQQRLNQAAPRSGVGLHELSDLVLM